MRLPFAQSEPSIVLGGALVLGALGGGLIWLGLDEKLPWLVRAGAIFGAAALALVVLLGIRGGAAVARRAPAWAKSLGGFAGRRRGPVIAGVAAGCVLFGLVLHNYILWTYVERECERALKAASSEERRAALERGMEAMNSALLVFPSDLFDRWGPRRCEKARGLVD